MAAIAVVKRFICLGSSFVEALRSRGGLFVGCLLPHATGRPFQVGPSFLRACVWQAVGRISRGPVFLGIV